MSQRFIAACAALCAGAAAVLVASCASERTSFDGAGGTEDFSALDGGGTDACARCTADLRAVVDCEGKEIMRCPEDTACGSDGRCVSPCAAAEQNQSSLGCDFMTTSVGQARVSMSAPGCREIARGYCHAIVLANAWTRPASIEASYGGVRKNVERATRLVGGQGTLTFDPLEDGRVPAGRLAVVFLASRKQPLEPASAGASCDDGTGARPFDPYFVDCPPGVEPLVTDDYASVLGTGLGKAFRITTDAPVVAYDVYPFGGAKSFVPSATLLLPTSAWGTSHVTVDAADKSTGNQVQVVAREETQVELVSPNAITGSAAVTGGPAGVAVRYRLAAGEVLQLEQAGLGGAVVTSDRPVSVFAGAPCSYLPADRPACDALHQQVPSAQVLGSDYVAARYPSRSRDARDPAFFRVTAMSDGTELVFDPELPAVATGRLRLSAGETLYFPSDGSFRLKSQGADHPFFLAQYMTGGAIFDGALGDPEFVVTVPTEQWLPRYAFLTDPSFANTTLIFTRRVGGAAVTLDCLGEVGDFVPVGTSGFESASIDLVRAGVNGGGGRCANGVHVAESANAFGLTVWGLDRSSSYAFPAGMATRSLTTFVPQPPRPR